MVDIQDLIRQECENFSNILTNLNNAEINNYLKIKLKKIIDINLDMLKVESSRYINSELKDLNVIRINILYDDFDITRAVLENNLVECGNIYRGDNYEKYYLPSINPKLKGVILENLKINNYSLISKIITDIDIKNLNEFILCEFRWPIN